MDLSIGLLGVLGIVGYNFRSKRENEKNKRNSLSPNTIPSGESVYESKDYLKVKQTEKDNLDNFYKNSIVVKGTNNIGTSYNSTNAEKNKVTYKKRFQGPHDVPVEKTQPDRVFSGPMFNIALRYQEEEDKTELKEGFTGTKNFSQLSGRPMEISHQNMTPFFGSHPETVMNNNSKTILSKHTGEYRPQKRETFQVINGPVDNVNGTPLTRPDASRYIVSDKQTNVLPFEQIKVKPIPTEHTRILPKTVDELRQGSNNKKYTYAGRINHGASEFKRGFVGEVNKNRPDSHFKQKYFFTTKSSDPESAPVVNFNDDFRTTQNKQLLESSYNKGIIQKGGFGTTTRISAENDGRSTFYQGDNRNTLKNDWVRNHKNHYLRNPDAQFSYHAPEQERETTSRRDLIGLKGEAAMYSKLQDTARTTNKQNTLYSYSGNIESPGNHVPADRSQYNNTEFKTRPTREYTPSGLSSKGQGTEFINITQADRPSVNDYIGIGSTLIPGITNQNLIGEMTYSYNPSEHNFSDRIVPDIKIKSKFRN